MTDPALTAYDRVLYPGHAFGQSHPDRLATVASLYGMHPAPIPRCRVLELGCGTGRNLIPMAYQWPDSEFLGIDLTERAIALGASTLADLALTNIELRRLDIMDVTSDLGRFDYIIAHGVYSWVPPQVRSKILEVIRTNLAPHGVGYVSYNTYPGAYLTDLSRRMMLFHVRNEPDPHEKIRQSRALLSFLADASGDGTLYSAVLRAENERIRAKADPVLFHDDLDEAASPFFLYQFVEDAAQHGLQYLADAAFPIIDLAMHPKPEVRLLERIPPHDLAMREQYLDFITGRGFRQTLLCHSEVMLNRSLDPACIKNYQLAAASAPESGAGDASPTAPTELSAQGGYLSTDHPLSVAALLHLGKIWPRATPFGALLQDVVTDLADTAAPDRQNLESEVQALTTVLFQAFVARQINLHLYPPRLTTEISDRPMASLLARHQAKTDSHITNLCHGTVSLEDEAVRKFLILVDGTRDIEQLVVDLNAAAVTAANAAGQNRSGEAQKQIFTRETVAQNLEILRRLGLLIS